ncbi:MAG: ABC transporter ATP-binding protein [Planctomycetota bacterium]|jgi:ATP-binding cassette subfamily B protein/subfamily B ATP-binding cassette protein MsbA
MSPLRSSKQEYRRFRADDANPPQVAAVKNEPAADTSRDATDTGRDAGVSGRSTYFRQYARWLWPHKARFLVVFVLALASAAMSLVLPLVTRYVIDDILTQSDLTVDEKLHQLAWLCGVMMVLLLAAMGTDTSRSYLMSVLNAKVIFRLRQKLFDRFLRLPLSDLSELKTGGGVSRLSQDVDKVTGMVQMAVITPTVAATRVILTVAVLVFISWQMALMASALIPPVVLINLVWLRRVRPIYRAMADSRSEIDARVTETLSGIRVVRSFRRERREEREYAVSHHTIIRKKLLAERLRLVVSGGWGLLIPVVSLAIVGFGGYRVIRGQGTVGDIIAFQMYAFMLLHPVSQIVNSLSSTQQSLAAMERVFEIMERPEELPDVPGAVPAPSPIREIHFDKVCFEYRQDLPVLEDITLTVPGSSTVALVGPSGGGKTTLIDLVARFHDPTSGRVLVNGVDLRTVRLAGYREQLAIVPQEVFLFDGSVRENIAYGRRSADTDAILDAARRANAHEFIELLPEGYDTLIGERGVKLSGGQRQRLSIARAILADPEILILDEATSNLDTESEQLIQQSLADLLSARTTFVIAHRLSTVTHADIIVVINQGRIEQLGGHAELIGQDGLYRDMVERQHGFAAEPTSVTGSDVRSGGFVG